MPINLADLFSLEINDHNLTPEFRPGDVLIVDKTRKPIKGSIVVASFAGVDRPLVILIDEQLQNWRLFNKNTSVNLEKLAGKIVINGVVIYKERSLV